MPLDENSAPSSPYHAFLLSGSRPAQRVRELVEKGRRLLEAGRVDEARRLFLQVLSLNPEVTPALNNLAIIALNEGDTERALQVIDESLRHDPADPTAHAIAAQCWMRFESDPMVQGHAAEALAGLLKRAHEGERAEPGYTERTVPFVLHSLLLAQDERSIIELYETLSSYEWGPLELTWIGIAYFNRGRIQAAHHIWRDACRDSENTPAETYALLVDHISSGRLLPFRLDFDLLFPEEADFAAFVPATVVTAHMVNELFESDSAEAQSILSYLVEQEMPGLTEFLYRLLRAADLPEGLRLMAAVQLLWEGEPDEPLRTFYETHDYSSLDAVDRPVYCLLGAALAREQGDESGLEAAREWVGRGLAAAAQCDAGWAAEYLEEMEQELDELDGLGDPDLYADGDEVEYGVLRLVPNPEPNADDRGTTDMGRGKGRSPHRRR